MECPHLSPGVEKEPWERKASSPEAVFLTEAYAFCRLELHAEAPKFYQADSAGLACFTLVNILCVREAGPDNGISSRNSRKQRRKLLLHFCESIPSYGNKNKIRRILLSGKHESKRQLCFIKSDLLISLCAHLPSPPRLHSTLRGLGEGDRPCRMCCWSLPMVHL